MPPWPAFSNLKPRVMHFDAKPSAHLGVPNVEQLKALDSYFAWRRKETADSSR